MATNITLIVKRGLSTNRLNYTPAEGELIITTDTHELYVGDGQTPGGIKVDVDYFIKAAEKGEANGVATLDENGKIPTDQLPPLSISDVFVVDSEDAQLALDAQTGDIAVRTDENKTYIRNSNNNGDMSDWTQILTPQNVSSVNGKTGDVVLNMKDINDVDSTLSPANGDVLVWDDTDKLWKAVSQTQITPSFLSLSDTPSSYTGYASALVQVKSDESGLEYTRIIDGGIF